MKTIASICTSGGILEQGAIATGLTPIWGVEIDSEVAELYRLNYPDSHIYVSNVNRINWQSLKQPDILHASPPCRNYSQANNKVEAAEDIAIARSVARAIEHFKPEVFTLENVRAYAKSSGWHTIEARLHAVGYSVQAQIVRLDRWGVPQSRVRFIAVAFRDIPAPLLLTPNRTKYWYEEIEDLIPQFGRSNLTNTQKDKLSPIIKNAIASGIPVLLKRIQIRKYTPAARADKPNCWTVTAKLCTDGKGSDRRLFADLITKDGIFSLNIRALARLQTIPDGYKFTGNVRVDGGAIGDGVPSYFAEQMYQQIMDYLKRGQRAEGRWRKGLVRMQVNYSSENLDLEEDKFKADPSALCPSSKARKSVGGVPPLELIEQEASSAFESDVALGEAEHPGECSKTGRTSMNNISDNFPDREDTYHNCDRSVKFERLSQLAEYIKSNAKDEIEFYHLGSAFDEIRTEKLFEVAGYTSFYKYCLDTFGKKQTYVQYLINAASIYKEVEFVVKSKDIELTESHCRELKKIKDVEMRSLVLKQAAEAGTITAKTIASTFNTLNAIEAQKNNSLPLPEINSVVRIVLPKNCELEKFRNYWGIVRSHSNYTCTVDTAVGITPNILPQYLMILESFEGQEQLLTRLSRILALQEFPEIKPFAYAIATSPNPTPSYNCLKFLDMIERSQWLV